jgi:hypothetical protein
MHLTVSIDIEVAYASQSKKKFKSARLKNKASQDKSIIPAVPGADFQEDK